MAQQSIVALGSVQKHLGIRGAVSEIGVHHGRLFILLHLLTEASEASVAWDLFESQNDKADGSGRGNKGNHSLRSSARRPFRSNVGLCIRQPNLGAAALYRYRHVL